MKMEEREGTDESIKMSQSMREGTLVEWFQEHDYEKSCRNEAMTIVGSMEIMCAVYLLCILREGFWSSEFD